MYMYMHTHTHKHLSKNVFVFFTSNFTCSIKYTQANNCSSPHVYAVHIHIYVNLTVLGAFYRSLGMLNMNLCIQYINKKQKK